MSETYTTENYMTSPPYHRSRSTFSAEEKETLVQVKEVLRYSGALTITICALVYAVLMYSEGTLSGSYLHFFDLYTWTFQEKRR